MNLNVLRYIIEVERSRSITGAAKQLFISQPNLSRDIRELEEEIGFTVFTRSSRRGAGRLRRQLAQLPRRNPHGERKGIPCAGQKSGKAVSGPGKLLQPGRKRQYQPAYLCPPGQLYHLRLYRIPQKICQRPPAVRQL